jgi:hypothetical protein
MSDNNDYRLIKGLPIHLKNGFIVAQHKFSTIEEYMTYDEYERIIYSLTRFPYEFKFDLEDIGIDYMTKNSFDIFLMLNGDMLDVLHRKLNFIFLYYNKDNKKYELENFIPIEKKNTIIFKSLKSDLELNTITINEIKKVLMNMFFMSIPKERKPANEMAKELVKRDIELKRKERADYDIYSIIDSLVWSSGSKYDYKTIFELTPHQIYRGYNRIDRIKNFDYLMNGVYSGMIDSDNIEKRINKNNWINKN